MLFLFEFIIFKCFKIFIMFNPQSMLDQFGKQDGWNNIHGTTEVYAQFL